MKSSKMKLSDSPVVIFDLQTTGADPKSNFILEVAWSIIRAGKNSETVAHHLIKKSKTKSLPWPVQRITGIDEKMLAKGKSLKAVLALLLADINHAFGANSPDWIPMVIHYASFEEKYLQWLTSKYQQTSLDKLQLICTHEISCRLFPDLPRRSLRALSGYLGYSVSHMRRAKDHVLATRFIWQKLIASLQKEHQVKTWGDLSQWLERPVNKSRSKNNYPMDKGLLTKLPDAPGVYHFIRTNGDLLYVGKATSLKNRVRSYFQSYGRHAEKNLEMLSQAQKINYFETSTILEAALLENDDIKKYSPPYNIALKSVTNKLVYVDQHNQLINTVKSDQDIGGFSKSPKVVEALAELRRIASTKQPKKINVPVLLGTNPNFTPDIGCLRQGLKLFSEKYRPLQEQTFSRMWLKQQGNLLWQEKIARDAQKKKLAELVVLEDEQETPKGVDLTWTPEMVLYALERVISQASHLQRKSKWLLRLSESTLCWSNQATGPKRLVVIEAGKIITQKTIRAKNQLPLPSGFQKTRRERQKSFDVQTYDRLCILTSELKKIVTHNGFILLRFGRNAWLGTERFKRTMPWL